jgi:hypothetical protein
MAGVLFFWNSIPNIVIVAGLGFYLYKRRSIGAVLVAMFSYLSLHGGYAVFAAATGDGINTLNTLHFESSDLGAKLVGACFLFVCGVLLCLRIKNPVDAARDTIVFRPALVILPILFLACMGYSALNLADMTSGQRFTAIKESVFAACMWAGAAVFAVAIKQGHEYFDYCRKDWLTALGVLGVLVTGVGFYEIVTEVVWAGTYYSTGFSYRSSSTLFNPNVLGFWSAMAAALISLIFHLQWISRFATFVCMMVVICLLVLSSSRSGLMLSIVNLVAVSSTLLLRRKSVRQSVFDQTWPLGAFVLAFAVTALFIESSSPGAVPAINNLSANLQRFLQLPADLFWTGMIRIIFPAIKKIEPAVMSFLQWMPENYLSDKLLKFSLAFIAGLLNITEAVANTYESSRVIESISGRLTLQYTSDNSFVSIYAIGGPASLAAWLCQWGVLFWIGIKKSITSPGVLSAHALGALVFCFASGFFLRTPQLFPVWMFLAMVLGACLCWWSPDSTELGTSSHQKTCEPNHKTCAS